MLKGLKGILSNAVSKNADNKSFLITNLTAYFFSAKIRGFDKNERVEFKENLSRRIKLIKNKDRLYPLLSYGLLIRLINKVYDKKENIFIRRITQKVFPDNRVLLSKRKYFTLKDFLLHLHFLSIKDVSNYKNTFDFESVKDFDLNIYDLDDYFDYISSITKIDKRLSGKIREQFLTLILEEIPQLVEFIGERA